MVNDRRMSHWLQTDHYWHVEWGSSRMSQTPHQDTTCGWCLQVSWDGLVQTRQSSVHNCFIRWALILSRTGSRIDGTIRCTVNRQTTFEEAFSNTVLLNEIRDPQEKVPCCSDPHSSCCLPRFWCSVNIEESAWREQNPHSCAPKSSKSPWFCKSEFQDAALSIFKIGFNWHEKDYFVADNHCMRWNKFVLMATVGVKQPLAAKPMVNK